MFQTEIVDAFKNESQDRIIKLHLFDDSLNVHGWGIDKEFAASLAKQYEGTPYLIPPDLNHPVRPYLPYLHDASKDIEDIKRYASDYIAGQCFKTELCASGKFGYDGYVKLTHPKAIEAFDKGLMPRYASISLYNLDNINEGYIRKGQALNICAVRKPAFSNAEILGVCKGNENSCHSNLKNASASQPANHYCILETLTNQQNDFERFTQQVNTSLKIENEKHASYNQMSSTSTPEVLPPAAQQQQTFGTNSSPQVTTPQPQAPQQQPQPRQLEQPQPEPEQPQETGEPETEEEQKVQQQIMKEIDEIADTKKAYEDLKLQSSQRDAVLANYQKQIQEFQQREEALKIREIERHIGLDLFNGDSKEREKKVKEWKDRAATMTLDDISWHLGESYGRKGFYIDKEKKAGLNYEPTAVLSGSGSAGGNKPKTFSVYDVMGGGI